MKRKTHAFFLDEKSDDKKFYVELVLKKVDDYVEIPLKTIELAKMTSEEHAEDFFEKASTALSSDFKTCSACGGKTDPVDEEFRHQVGDVERRSLVKLDKFWTCWNCEHQEGLPIEINVNIEEEQ